MAKNWWFKFEYRVWQSDPDLSGCSLAARGLWLEILCSLYAQDEHTLTASYERLGRMARCDSSEIAKLVVELKQNKVADVTLGHGDVTVTSRRLKKLLKARKDATLRKQKERVTQKSQDRVRSKSKSNKKEEEKSAATAASPASGNGEMEQSPFDHPAVVVYQEKFGVNVSRSFATEVGANVKNLSLWNRLITEKIAFASGSVADRQRIAKWFLAAYLERAEKNGQANDKPKRPTGRQLAAEARAKEEALL